MGSGGPEGVGGALERKKDSLSGEATESGSGQNENAGLLVQKVLSIQDGDSRYLDGEGARGLFRLS